MANIIAPVRIDYVEDGDFWREHLGDMFDSGFRGPDVIFRPAADFEQIKEDLLSGDLARAYILDNEITSDRHTQGGEIAQKIHDRAAELGMPVTIINLLSSNPDVVRRQYGKELDDRGIGIAHKLLHAPLVGLHIGNVLRLDQPPSFSSFLASEEMTLPVEDAVSRNLSDVMTSVARRNPGAFYFAPEGFMHAFGTGMAEKMLASDGSEGVQRLITTFGRRPGIIEGRPPRKEGR